MQAHLDSPSPGASRTVHALFAAAAARAPKAVSLVCGAERLDYAALDARSNQMAWYLRGRGVVPGTRVAMLLPRSIDAIVTMLAVLKAGAAFVPLDAAYPEAQRAAVVADSQPVLTIAEPTLLTGQFAASTVPILTLAREASAIAAHSASPLPNVTTSEDPAYVMYTSGSTGRPKGVLVPHRGIIRLVIGTEYAKFGPDEVFLQLAPLAFDASTFEIWGSLLHGSVLAILPDPRPTLNDIADAIARHGVTTMWLTAGLFHLMVDHRIDALAGLGQLLAGGDVLSPTHVRKLLETAPGCRLINGYGPTENTTFTCCHTISLADLDGGTVPIGRPIAGSTAHVLDPDLRPVPDGAEGQLCTGGSGVALGYLGQPELTAERFIPDPFAETPNARMYLTGDLVRRRPDGALLFLGRLDRQAKINGHRVEFEEIELALRRQPGVRDAIVLLREDTPGRKRLVAYVTGSSAGVIEGVRATLPEWSVPSTLIVLTELPLNANGKVDRAKLPPPASGPILAPANQTEQALAEIWRRVLGLAEVSRDANFFDLGGTSLQLIEAHAEIQRSLAPDVNLMDLFRDPSIGALAARLTDGISAHYAKVTSMRSAGDNRPLPENNPPPAPPGGPAHIPAGSRTAALRAGQSAEALRRIREARGR
jgi:amino acid adenylation domain-containing protein